MLSLFFFPTLKTGAKKARISHLFGTDACGVLPQASKCDSHCLHYCSCTSSSQWRPRNDCKTQRFCTNKKRSILLGAILEAQCCKRTRSKKPWGFILFANPQLYLIFHIKLYRAAKVQGYQASIAFAASYSAKHFHCNLQHSQKSEISL